MAYKQLKDGTIVIKGFEYGISDDPYKGLADMRNMNIISIPGESSVNFKTSQISAPVSSGAMSTTSAADDTITIDSNLEFAQAIYFITLSDTSKGLSLNTPYWIRSGSSGTYTLRAAYPTATAAVNITGDGVTGTWATYNIAQPKYFTKDNVNVTPGNYWMLDSSGQCWSNILTTTGSGYWTYMGNYGGGVSNNTLGMNGNGLGYYQASDGTAYVFVFRNSAIDYTPALASGISWVYGWKPSDASTGNAPGYLKTTGSQTNSHEVLIAPDNALYFCDSNYIGRWFQTSSSVAFVPTTLATYTFDQTPLLPFTDTANCLAFLGTNVMVGGIKNVIYPWDTTSPTYSYPLMIAESLISKMLTINTNTFILAGNRGRIYVTNGSQANLYKKIPDHISGTVEPYFTWGGIASTKNQLYFSASCTTNSGTANNNYGGLWAIDVDTKAMRLTNKLSYNTYAGFASAMIPVISPPGTNNPGGTGLFIGWNSGASTYGIDQTLGTPYIAGESTVDSDYIPIGTAIQPTTNGTVEFKLAVPVVSGESVKLQYRQKISDSFVDISSDVLFTYATSTAGGGTGWNGYSGIYQNVNFENSQWVQIRAVLTSTNSSPSYVRLTEIRIK